DQAADERRRFRVERRVEVRAVERGRRPRHGGLERADIAHARFAQVPDQALMQAQYLLDGQVDRHRLRFFRNAARRSSTSSARARKRAETVPPSSHAMPGRIVTALFIVSTVTSTSCPFRRSNACTTSIGRVTARELPVWTTERFIYVFSRYDIDKVNTFDASSSDLERRHGINGRLPAGREAARMEHATWESPISPSSGSSSSSCC